MPGPKQQPATTHPTPFPKNWNSMSPQQKRAWQAQNRPRPTTPQPVTPAGQKPQNAPQRTIQEQAAQTPEEGEQTETEAYNENLSESFSAADLDAAGLQQVSAHVDARAVLSKILFVLAEAFKNGTPE